MLKKFTLLYKCSIHKSKPLMLLYIGSKWSMVSAPANSVLFDRILYKTFTCICTLSSFMHDGSVYMPLSTGSWVLWDVLFSIKEIINWDKILHSTFHQLAISYMNTYQSLVLTYSVSI